MAQFSIANLNISEKIQTLINLVFTTLMYS